jgi:hypothetical protein
MASPYAACAFVSCAVRVHRIPLPTSVTIAKRPLDLERDGRIVSVIWVKREAEFFYPPDWTGQISLSRNEKFDFWRI